MRRKTKSRHVELTTAEYTRRWSATSVCVCVLVCVCVCVCVCSFAFVCVRERESVCVRERESERARESVHGMGVSFMLGEKDRIDRRMEHATDDTSDILDKVQPRHHPFAVHLCACVCAYEQENRTNQFEPGHRQGGGQHQNAEEGRQR